MPLPSPPLGYLPCRLIAFAQAVDGSEHSHRLLGSAKQLGLLAAKVTQLVGLLDGLLGCAGPQGLSAVP